MNRQGNSRKRPRVLSEDEVFSNEDEDNLATLIDMFPSSSVKFLKEKLTRNPGTFESLIDRLLNNPDEDSGDDGDSGVVMDDSQFLADNASFNNTYDASASIEIIDDDPGPSSSHAHAPNTYIERNYSTLASLFPEVSPIFLQEKVWDIGDDPGKLEQFISQSFEIKSSLPSRKDYDKQETVRAEERKIRNLTARDFLAEFEDPNTYYLDKNRKCSELYKQHLSYYLSKHYPQLSKSKLQQILEKNNSLLVPCIKEIEITAKGKGKAKSKTSNTKLTKPDIMDIEFLKEYVYYKLEAKIKGIQDKKLKKRAEAVEEARTVGGLFECQVCFDEECLVSEVVMCDSGCMFCPSCVKRGAEVQIGENKIHFSCLLTCGATLPLKSLQGVLSKKLFSKLTEKIQLEEVKAAGIENLFQCPACNYAVIAPSDNDIKEIICGNPDCGRKTCKLCGEISHIPLTCDEVEKDDEVAARTKVENAMTEAMLRECVRCKKKYFKEEGCNKMTCECGQVMCYLCRKPVSNDYQHFYGQGGEAKPGLCPLWSNVNQLHVKEMTEAAKKAKEAVGGKLKVDPSKNIPKAKPDRGMPQPEDFEDDFDDDYDDYDEGGDDDEEELSDDSPDEDDIHFINDDDSDEDDGHYHYRIMDWF